MNTWSKPLIGALLAGVLAVGVAAPVVVAEGPEPDPGTQMALAKSESKPQADRWGLFVGEWAPASFAIGVAAVSGADDRNDDGQVNAMISTIQNLGVRSEHAYAAGF